MFGVETRGSHKYSALCPERFLLMHLMMIFILSFSFFQFAWNLQVWDAAWLHNEVLRTVWMVCPLPLVQCSCVGIPSGCMSITLCQPRGSGDAPASEAVWSARSSCVQPWQSVIWTLPAFLTLFQGVCIELCWAFALLLGLNSVVHPLWPWCLMQS